MSYKKRAALALIDWDEVRSLISDGHSYADVADRLGTTVHYIRLGLRTHQIDAHPSRDDAISFVYVIGPDGGPYKVGKADDPDGRRASLQNGNPYPLRIHLAYSVAAHRVHDFEAEVHQCLRSRAERLVGEWYRCSLREILTIVVENDCAEPDLFPDVDESPLVQDLLDG